MPVESTDVPARPGVGAAQRWEHLVEEHRRQAERRRVDERARYEDTRWARHLGYTVATMVGALMLVGLGWFSLDRATRNDPSRCPNPMAATSEVAVGGWAEPDECLWFDARGDPVGGDANFAGPVTRTYADVLADNALALALVAVAVVAAGAVAMFRLGAQRRSTSVHPTL
jgi:hypothetical protein